MKKFSLKPIHPHHNYSYHNNYLNNYHNNYQIQNNLNAHDNHNFQFQYHPQNNLHNQFLISLTTCLVFDMF